MAVGGFGRAGQLLGLVAVSWAFQHPYQQQQQQKQHLLRDNPTSSFLHPARRRRRKAAFLLNAASSTEALTTPVDETSPPSTPSWWLPNNNKDVSNISSTKTDSPQVGILLLNLGGPETSDDVEGFLYNLFADPDIIRLPGPLSPLQGAIAWFVSKRRAPKSREAYQSIGGGSPILQYSREQARLLVQAIQQRYGLTVRTYIGMRYWRPFTDEALDQIRRDGIQALVILPLYPQFSISTSGSSLRILQEEFSKNSWQYTHMVHTVVPSWYQRPGYVKALVNLLQKELDSFTPEEIEEARQEAPHLKPLHVLFSAHGVPRSYIEAGDPYQNQIVDCVQRIAAGLDADRVQTHLSYQSRVGPIEWLRPYTDDVLPELGQSGVRNLVVVPISFVSEHIETLEEIDIEYRELAHESGITNWRRCPALNTDPAFIEDLADLVMEALSEPAQTVTEACIANMVNDIDVEVHPLDERWEIATAGVQGVGSEGLLLKQRQEQLQKKPEPVYAAVALVGVLAVILVDLVYGKSLVHWFGF